MPTAIIWGGSGAIGSALAAELKERGWQVAGVARDELALNGTFDHTFEADFSSSQAVRDAAHAAGMELGEAQVFIYAAGDITHAPVEELSADDWRRILDANLTGAHLATHHSMPLLEQGAHLVYIGAVSERLRLPGLSAYGAAKVALEAYADALKKEQRKKKVLVVRPGAVDTDFWEKVPMSKPKSAMPPADLAAQIADAIENGEKGTLDL
jgi:NAD(P)-dependent dehydrogenase (short-subunit alcohol dehydrogenase family)